MWYAQVCTNVEHIYNCASALTRTIISRLRPLVVFHTVRYGDYWCKIDGIYACALLKMSNSLIVSFHFIHFVFVFFSGFEANTYFFRFSNFMLSNPII